MKTEVYSWRIDPALKRALEDAARARGATMAGLLDTLAKDWLGHADEADDQAKLQRAVRERAAPYLGAVQGGDPLRAQESSQRLKQRVRERHARNRTD